MSNSAFFSDLHIHTKQSGCAPRTSEAASYLPYCKQEGIRLLGISDHVYSDETLYECGYVNENKMSHLLVTRPILEELAKTSDVRFLFGCEAEYFPGQPPLISQEESLSFDYILMAASHVLNQPRMYSAYDIHDPNVLRKLTIDRFVEACKLDYPVPMGICHPLYPIGSTRQCEILDGISDACLNELFSMAAEKKISIEIHACLYRDGTPLNEYGLSDRYLRLLAAAKECGCMFHFGSDAHSPEMFIGVHDKLRKTAEILGITEDDIWPVAKGITGR